MNELLFHLMSPDNINRKNAEAQFSNQLESNFIITLQLLLTTFSDLNSDPILRSFSGILIRSSIEKYSTLLTSEMVIEIRNLLLTTWSSETNKLVFKRLAHMLAQLSLIGKLTDLIPTLMAISQTNKEQCLALLYFIETISDYNSDSIQINLNQLGGFLGQNIMSSDMSIQIATARATCACIVCLEDENQRNSFRAALGPIMNVIGACLTNGDETDASSIMDHLVTIANIQPVFFKGMVDQVVSAMISIANSASLEFSTQSIAVELIVTLAETAPALARRCDGLVSGLTPILFRFMTDRDESELSWVNEPYSEEITDGDYMLGEEAIERLATGIGGRMVSPEVLKFVELNSTQPTWQCRRAAVAGLHRLADGAPQYFSKSYLPMAQQLLLRMLADPSPIVQYEVLQAVGRFATIFPTEINTLIQNFVPPLVAILSNPMTCEKVKGHTVAALINLTNPDECGSEMLKPFADVLLGSLLHALQTSSVHVQSSCLILIGGVAKVIEDGFAAYYSSFMPGIKMILNQALTPDLAVLRGRAMECVGLLGEAVGADVFSADALDVMNALLGAIDLDKDSDLTFDYILPTCARISKALESRFETFLPLVMNPLLAGANQVIQFSMTDAYEDDVEGEVSRNEETGLESTVICLGAGIKKRVTLNTTALQQKQQAARMIFEFAKSLKGHLKSYLVPCIQSLLTMITDKNSADVRSSSCLALSKIFDAFLDATKSQFVTVDTLSEVLSASLGKLLEALKGEISCTARACGAESLRDILYACYSSGVESSDGTYSGPLCLPDLEISTAIAQELLQLCGNSISRKQVKEQEFASNEGLEVEDREAFAEELEEEEDSLTNLVDAIGQLLKLHGESFMPFFDQVVSPAFAPYLSTSQPESMQILAVCLIDDCIEFGGTSAHKYIEQMIPLFNANMDSGNCVLRQCSTYGIAQSLRFAPQICGPFLSALVPKLMAFVINPVNLEEENEGAKENAIYALGTIYHNRLYRSVSWGGIEPSQLTSLWLQNLPLRADEQEAKVAHTQLCDVIENGDINISDENYGHLTHLLRIISDIFLDPSTGTTAGTSTLYVPTALGGSNSLAHYSTLDRMRTIVKQVVTTGGLSQEIINRSMQLLTLVQQQALQQVI